MQDSYNYFEIAKDTSDSAMKSLASEAKTDALVSAVNRTGRSIENIPDLLRQVVENRAWTDRERGPNTSETFSSFRDFCTTDPPEGLGCDIDRLRDLCETADPEDNTEVRALLTHKLGQHGGDRSGGEGNAGDLDPNERGSDYLTARIARDHPEVHERMKNGEFSSVRQAAIEAGIIDDIRTKQIRETDGREKMEAKIRHVYGDEVADRLFRGEIQADPKPDADPPEAPDPEEIDPERASIYVENLQSAYSDGERGFQHVPGHIKRIIKEGLWRRVHAEETGETVTFDTFREFVTAPLPEGLGADPSTLVAMCQGDSEALGLLREHGIE